MTITWRPGRTTGRRAETLIETMLMVFSARRSALGLLACTVLLAGANPASAATPIERQRFVNLLTSSKFAGLTSQLLSPNQGVTATNVRHPIALQLIKEEQRLQQQSARITSRLQRLDTIEANRPGLSRAIE